MTSSSLPRIALFATGGTIVSSGADALQMTGYRIGDFTVDALLSAVPQLAQVARIEAREIARIDSMSMTSQVWKDLGAAIAEAAADPDIAGIVVTHGTDTMEETAWFTHLTAKTEKPIVFTGAMRPATALAADGPLNLLNAVRIAADPAARGRGVLIALNDVILSARDAMKTNPTNVAAFSGLVQGPLGLVAGDAIVWLGRPERPFGLGTPFSVEQFSRPRRLPRVDILYSHADDDGVLVRAAVAARAEVIVHAGTGNGSIHEECEKALAEAAADNVFIIRASRVPGGCVTPGLAEWQERGYIPAGTLSPQKCRILAMLVLVQFGWSPEKMKEAFATF
ncbi:asparaginase [Sutterella sp.]|uniref:asparaginase n=1 Tax=Sutterella sp. TaxID=1981025 RepID=UPI0026DF293D|nr:asparaginase [Sutterella sp.]MDO5530746.1 asparaginase [Sutterella sp.]